MYSACKCSGGGHTRDMLAWLMRKLVIVVIGLVIIFHWGFITGWADDFMHPSKDAEHRTAAALGRIFWEEQEAKQWKAPRDEKLLRP